MGLYFSVFAGFAIVATLCILFKESLEKRYFEQLPKSLKTDDGKYIVNSRLVRRIERLHKKLLETAKAKFLRERGPARILANEEVAPYIEKFINEYSSEFGLEISDGRLEWAFERIRLFFELLEHKYSVSNRSLLKTILYIRSEMDFFDFIGWIAQERPKNFRELAVRCVRYGRRNSTPVSAFDIRRASYLFKITPPLGPVKRSLYAASKSIELNQFDQVFSKNIRGVSQEDPAEFKKSS